MIPDEQAMISLVKRVERVANMRGWDGPATLHLIVEEQRPERLMLYPSPVQPQDLHGNAAFGLEIFAAPFADGELDAGIGTMPSRERDALAGLLFCWEAWSVTDEQAAAFPGIRNADTPGGKEVRGAVAMDAAGYFYVVQRVRGQKPFLQIQDEPYGGRVPVALARVLRACLRHSAPDAVNIDRLSAWADCAPLMRS